MVDLVEYRRAKREDVEARYPAVELNQAAARGVLRRYFSEMGKGKVPAPFDGKATPVGAYRVNGCVVYHYALDEAVGEVTGYVMADDWTLPQAVRGGDPLPALWMVAEYLRR